MAILSSDKRPRKIQIDLAGPDGNAMVLIGIADSIGKQLGIDPDERAAIRKDMMSSDYEHVVATLEKHYGDFIEIYDVK